MLDPVCNFRVFVYRHCILQQTSLNPKSCRVKRPNNTTNFNGQLFLIQHNILLQILICVLIP